MKGRNLCFGVLLVLFAIFGFSFVASPGVSALKHQFKKMPLYNLHYVVQNPNTQEYLDLTMHDPYFNFHFDANTMPDFDLDDTVAPVHFNTTYNASSEKCAFDSLGSDGSKHWVISGQDLTWGIGDKYSDLLPTSTANNKYSRCRQLKPFNEGIPDLDKSSFNFNIGQPNTEYLSLYPYSYSYNTIEYYGETASSSGYIYRTRNLFLRNYLGNNVRKLNSPYSLTLPIGILANFKSSDFTDVNVGTPLDFDYEIYLTDIVDYNISYWENARVRLYWNGIDTSYTMRNGHIDCEKSYVVDYDDFGNLYGLRLVFKCPFVSQYDFLDGALAFNYNLLPVQNSTKIWDVTFDSCSEQANEQGTCLTGDVVFFSSSIDVITNYDDTPGGELDFETNGGDTGSDPGSSQFQLIVAESRLESNNGMQWADSLIHLFEFSLLNPFKTLFDMFSDSNSCASIPTLAGMLHFNQNYVCPWFPSSVRNVTTPVFSIVGVMLVFGFAVRWLGASSGNFFEDSGSIDSPGVGRSGDSLVRHGWRIKK